MSRYPIPSRLSLHVGPIDSTDAIVSTNTAVHYSNDRSLFINFKSIEPTLFLCSTPSGNVQMNARGKGDLILNLPNRDEEPQRCQFLDALYVPDAEATNISIQRMEERGRAVAFGNNHLTIQWGPQERALARIPRRDGVYKFSTRISGGQPRQLEVEDTHLGLHQGSLHPFDAIFSTQSSTHVSNDRSLFQSLQRIRPIQLKHGSADRVITVEASQKGTMLLDVPNNRDGFTRVGFPDALYSPDFMATIISLPKFESQGASYDIDRDVLRIELSASGRFEVVRKDGVFKFSTRQWAL